MSTTLENLSQAIRILAPTGPPIPTDDALDAKVQSLFGEQEEGRSDECGPRHDSSDRFLVRIGLIDSFTFTRDCLIQALLTPVHGFAIRAFETTTSLISSGMHDIDVILYCDHEQAPSFSHATVGGARLHEEIADIPIIVLSDATTALTPETIKAALKCGVRGFISTRTFEMRTVSAAIRFVTAGGVFVPVNLLLAEDVKPAAARDEAAPPAGLLTPRQATVLSLLQQGKANKIIAYELGMSESTVKVHIRNIMRKIGATNRTQAIYKLQQLSDQKALGMSAIL